MKISTGSEVFDELLCGGLDSDAISIVYGPGGSGKTNVCLHAAISAVLSKKKVIYVDTEGSFSVERISQLEDFDKDILKSIFFLRPTTFSGQKNAFEKLKEMADDKIGIIIIDSIAMLYRLAIGKSDRPFNLNRELGHQIAMLANITRKKNIPVLLTNQVYSAMDDTDSVVMVGGDLLRYQSKCIIELQKGRASTRIAILKKHRSLPEGKKAMFEIQEKGLKLVGIE